MDEPPAQEQVQEETKNDLSSPVDTVVSTAAAATTATSTGDPEEKPKVPVEPEEEKVADNVEEQTAEPSDPQTPPASPDEKDEAKSPKDDESETQVVVDPWAEVLQSPNHMEPFSPGRDIHKPGSFHGYGLLLAVEHAKWVSRSGRSCLGMVLQVANLYETFAQMVEKALDAWEPPANSTDAKTQQILNLELAVQQSFASWTRETLEIVQELRRSNIGQDWHSFLCTHAETVPIVYQRYTISRIKAGQARQKALTAQNKYTKAVADAEQAVDEKKTWEQRQETLATTNTAAAAVAVLPSPAPRHKRWMRRLRDVQTTQHRYQDLVQTENQAVQQAHFMETLGLEALQMMEEERMHTFVEVMRRILRVQQERLERIIISWDHHAFEDKQDPSRKAGKKGGGDFEFFSNLLLKTATPNLFEDGLGVGGGTSPSAAMDAETLGLPAEIGTLRDKVRARFVARKERIRTAKSLASFLDDITSAASQLASGLQGQATRQDEFNQPTANNRQNLINGVHQPPTVSEGPKLAQIWKDYRSILTREAEATYGFSKALRTLRTEMLDNFLQTAERDYKRAMEADDLRWKQLCDAARAEARADARFKQTTLKTAKVRSRMKSMDDKQQAGGEQQQETPATGRMPFKPSPQKTKARMHKALGNMLSILPDGGEQAMQILTPDARLAVAQSNLQEADDKEVKDRQILEEATNVKNAALQTYKDRGQSVLALFQTEDDIGWADLKRVLEAIVANAQKLRAARVASLTEPQSRLSDKAFREVLSDLSLWTVEALRLFMEMKMKLQAEVLEVDASDESGIGFQLDFVRKVPKKVSAELESEEFVGGSTDGDDTLESCPSEDMDEITIEVEEEEAADESTAVLDDTSESRRGNVLRRVNTAPLARRASDTAKEIKNFAGTLRKRTASDMTKEMARANTPPPEPEAPIIGANTETDVFLNYFTADKAAAEDTMPVVIKSFACTYWPKLGTGRLSSLLHGRLFLTSQAIYFAGWSGQKLALRWTDVVRFRKEKNSVTGFDDALLVTCKRDDTLMAYFFAGLTAREETCEYIERLKADTIVRLKNEEQERAEAKAREEAEAKERAEKEEQERAEREREEKAKAEARVRAAAEEKKSDSPTGMGVPAEKVFDSGDVPDDTMLKGMEEVLDKTIKNVSVKRFYDIVWSEGNRSSEEALYGPWLANGPCFDIVVEDWEYAENGKPPFKNGWCGEEYQQRRQVSFRVKRQGFFIGPPVVGIKQTHYCRVEGNDKCVLNMTVEMEGIPYSDCFCIEVRWVARRKGANAVRVQVGVFVDFRKRVMLANKIRSATFAETAPVHRNLFEMAEKRCIAAGGVAEEEEAPVEEKAKPEKEVSAIEQVLAQIPLSRDNLVRVGYVLAGLFVYLFVSRLFSTAAPEPVSKDDVEDLGRRMDELRGEVKLIQETLNNILEYMKERDAVSDTSSSTCVQQFP